MPTVVVRFETCKKAIGYGTVYYRETSPDNEVQLQKKLSL